ncbi:MAG: amidase family protein [Rhizobiaceae bacterium]|jgi:amidase/6-aminohexanoate-cyclic-dimer hydrolase|nr:amidase family protein [Rhizobiaceae bacterium]
MSIATLYDTSDALGLAAHVAAGDVAPVELLDEAISRAEAVNPQLNAIAIRAYDAARAMIAAELPAGPFSGVPLLLKDNGAEARDFPSTGGSKLTANTVWDQDSTVFLRLKAAGLVPFARTTVPEFCVGPASEATVYGGPARNPWNLGRTPGGSSGGSAAAVAAGIVPAAHGSDGGGSIRIPASNCGLFGFKATRARLPDGPYAGEGWAGMAIEGFLSRSVRDSAALIDATAGHDASSPYRAPPLAESCLAATQRRLRGLRIAVCATTLTGAAIDPQCRAGVETTARLLEAMGHHVTEARPKARVEAMMRAWTKIVACGTALAIDGTLKAKGRDLQPGDIEPMAASARAYADTVSGADYLAAVSTIHAFGREMEMFFDDFDILLTATLAEPPAAIGRFNHTTDDYVDFRMGPGRVFDYSPFCAAFNASGQPAASLPLHWTADGLPIGIHIAAAFGRDDLIFALSAELERAAPWADRRPPVSTFT